MNSFCRGMTACGLLVIGYVLGASQILSPSPTMAQEEADGPSTEAIEKIRTAHNALNEAMIALEQERAYRPAIQGINSFAASVGGIDAIEDLESGRGVDPETFAGLYAGQAIGEVDQFLGKDDEGRVTYKNRVVRMYPISRLKILFSQRSNIAQSAETEN